MSWISLSIDTDCAHAEALADALMDAGALSASIEDADAGTPDEKPQFGEPGSVTTPGWDRSRVVALLEPGTDVDELLAACAPLAGLAALPSYTTTPVEEQNWVQLTQAQFEPIRVSGRLWIVPSWHEAPDPEAIVIVLDPGMAFGTGSHPTTRLCLEWLERTVQGGETKPSLLDYGCGSGILAIAALKLGAGRALGVDIDPQAVQSSRDNAAQNAVQADFYLPGELPDVETDVVVANILANPLRMLGALLTRHVRVGGRIVLSGILQEQAEEIRTLYQQWFEMDAPVFDDGWTCLSGRKR